MTVSNDRVAVITGGASGIGFAVAREFRSHGLEVVIADVDRETIDRAADELGAVGIVTDVRSAQSWTALRAHVVSRFGHVDILHNNAGVTSSGHVLDMTIDDWRWVLEVNLWGAINGIHTFLPDLVASGGHIINTASGAGLVPAWANAAYCASKYGLVGLSEVMRKELAEDAPGVAISVVFPTATATRIVDSDRLFPADLERRPPTEAETSRLAVKRERLAAGMDPRDVATKVWSAVVDRRFWVFPWAGTADWAMERALEIKDAADRQ